MNVVCSHCILKKNVFPLPPQYFDVDFFVCLFLYFIFGGRDVLQFVNCVLFLNDSLPRNWLVRIANTTSRS